MRDQLGHHVSEPLAKPVPHASHVRGLLASVPDVVEQRHIALLLFPGLNSCAKKPGDNK